jgi:hypothetical protein
VCGEPGLDLVARDPLRIHVAPRRLRPDGQERHALVLERRRDRPVEQPVQVEELARARGAPLRGVDPLKLRGGLEGLRMQRALVHALDDRARLEQLRERGALGLAQVTERRREADRHRAIEDRAHLRLAPVAFAELHVVLAGARRDAGGRDERNASHDPEASVHSTSARNSSSPSR